jgi:hypothetical protein
MSEGWLPSTPQVGGWDTIHVLLAPLQHGKVHMAAAWSPGHDASQYAPVPDHPYVCNQLCPGLIAKLGLDARVAVVDAEMVGLDRTSRLLELSDGSQLPYDILMVTSGLQVGLTEFWTECSPKLLYCL